MYCNFDCICRELYGSKLYMQWLNIFIFKFQLNLSYCKSWMLWTLFKEDTWKIIAVVKKVK